MTQICSPRSQVILRIPGFSQTKHTDMSCLVSERPNTNTAQNHSLAIAPAKYSKSILLWPLFPFPLTSKFLILTRTLSAQKKHFGGSNLVLSLGVPLQRRGDTKGDFFHVPMPWQTARTNCITALKRPPRLLESSDRAG